MNDRTVIPQQVADDAAEWFARLETERTSETTRRRFVDWLTRSPVHIEEFLRVSALHRALSRELKAQPDWLADVLADASMPPDNVVSMPDTGPSSQPTPAEAFSGRGRFLWAAAAALLLAVGIGWMVRVGLPPLTIGDERVVATDIGEQRRVVLADGSGVQLNTETEIRVQMGDRLRQVHLVRGEAIFDVEKDPTRPFRVDSGTAVVEAIGTRFNVYRKPDQTVVTVVEGRVAVSPTAEAPERPRRPQPEETQEKTDEPELTVPPRSIDVSEKPVELDAGQKVTVATDGTVAAPAPVDVDRATSWTRRRMVFDADTLDTVVAEFNRYNREPLVIADTSLSNRRITGVFNIDDPEAFLALLGDLEDIHIERGADGTRKIRWSEVESPN
jgi:transmembrane sensor